MYFRPVYPPLLPAFSCICAGILAAAGLPDLPYAATLSLFALSLAAVFFFRIPTAVAAVAILAGIWGMASMTRVLSLDRKFPGIEAFADGSPYTISGRIASFAGVTPRTTRYVLSCDSLASRGGCRQRVTGKINFSVYKKGREAGAPPLLYGTRIEAEAKLRSIRNFANPGGFDYEQYLRFKGITASAWADAGHVRSVPGPDPPAAWVRIVQHLQETRQNCHRFILGRTASNIRDGPLGPGEAPDGKGRAAAVLSAMALGEKTGLSMELRDSFARAGVSHLLAVSGLHLSIVGFVAYLIFLQCFRPFPHTVSRGWARKAALALTLIPLAGYAVLAGFSPATQRALIMASVFVAALMLDHETDPVNTLCLAGILILAKDPASLFSISFQLSFTAVAGIITGMTWVSRKGLLPRSRPLARIFTAFWVSLFAGLATLPLTAHYFNTASFVFVLSNLFLVPVMGLVCLPLGLAAAAVFLVYPPLACPLLDLALALISWCLALVTAVADCPFTWARVITPTWLEIFLYYLMAGGLLAFSRGRKRTGTGLAALAAAAGICCAGMDVKQRFFPGDLTAVVMDVGQGASALVRTPGGKTILMDCGGFSSGTGFDVGRYVVGPYLWRNRILSIDIIVLSHPQADHMNGLAFIMDNFGVGRLIRNRDVPPSRGFGRLMEICRDREIPVSIPVFPGMELDIDGVRLFLAAPSADDCPDLNHNSLVARLVFQSFSMLFTGDIDAAREFELCGRVPLLPLSSRVMVAPHHGSRSASTKIFLDHVNPESIIVSCGYENRYGFPHIEVLNRYHAENIKVYRTDLSGAVSVSSRGRDYEISPTRKN